MKKIILLLLPVFLLSALTIQTQTPVITITGTLGPFVKYTGYPSAEQVFQVSGTSLTGNLVVTAPAGFELSTLSGSGFTGSVLLTPSAGTVINTLIYVRVGATTNGSTPSDSIICSSIGATTQNMGVSFTTALLPNVNYFAPDASGSLIISGNPPLWKDCCGNTYFGNPDLGFGNFTSSVIGTTARWTNNDTSIGLPASGTGNIPPFGQTPNLTDSLRDATITVTPIYTSPLVTINGSLVTGDMTESGRLFRNEGYVSTCNSQKPFPGSIPGTYLYDSYNYTNTTGASQCITVGYITNSDSGDVFVSAYNGIFNPNDLSANYLADGGISSQGTSDPGHGPVTFSCNVANGATVVLVANEVSGACPSYTITISDFNSGVILTGTPVTFHMYSNPIFRVNQPDNQVVCNNQNTLPVNFTSNPNSLSFIWNNSQPFIGLGYIQAPGGFSGGTGNIPSFMARNTTNAPLIANIYVSEGGSPLFYCLPGPFQLGIANNSPGSSSKGFQKNNGSLQQQTNTVNTKKNPWDNGHGGSLGGVCDCGCQGPYKVFTITVNPTPIVDSVPNQVVCNGTSTSPVIFSSPTTGGTLVYNWTNDNPGIGLAASGTGDIASFLRVNNSAFPITATITVTPSFTNAGLTCTGSAITFTITVNPVPDVKYFIGEFFNSFVSPYPFLPVDCCGNIAPANSNDSTPVASFTGSLVGTLFSWTNDNTNIGLPASGTGNIARFNPPVNLTNSTIDATITVTPMYSIPLVTINGSLAVGDMTEPNRLFRNDSKVSTCDSLKPFPGTQQGAHLYDTYNYTNTTGASQCITVSYIANSNSGDVFVSAYNGNFNPNDLSAKYLADGGVSSLGTSDPSHGPVTFSCNVANGATVVLVANEVSGSCPSYTITISDFNSGVICRGTPSIFHMVSSPVYQVDQPDNQIVCNNGNTLPVSFTSNFAGLCFGWYNSQPSIGLGAASHGYGKGNIQSFPAQNSTNAPITANIYVHATDLDCPLGANKLPVKSTKAVKNSNASPQQNSITIKTNPWDNIHGASGSCGGCQGPDKVFTITVNPTPIVDSVPNQVICNGALTSPVIFSSPTIGGTLVYNWTNDNPGIGLAASGTGDIASFLPVNNTAFPVTATITVIPSFTNAGATCTGTPVTFTITVSDNNTSFIIYASEEARFGRNNTIGGDVGVTASEGRAAFEKGDVLNPYRVYAKNITARFPSHVNNRIYAKATGGPNLPFIMYNGSGGSGTFVASSNGTINGNFRHVIIRERITATVTGNDFGKIEIMKGANVTFSNTLINVRELDVAEGDYRKGDYRKSNSRNRNTTNVYFSGPTYIKVSERVNIGEDCRINMNGPEMIFYLGDSDRDGEKFTVEGNNTWITANIMIPNGKLLVHGGESNCLMTGWYIVKKLNSDGKNVIWNREACSSPMVPLANTSFMETNSKINESQVVGGSFDVKVYPNPTPGDFYIKVFNGSNEFINVRIINMYGELIKTFTTFTTTNFISLSGNLPGGTYFVELKQGKNKKVVKLIKMK